MRIIIWLLPILLQLLGSRLPAAPIHGDGHAGDPGAPSPRSGTHATTSSRPHCIARWRAPSPLTPLPGGEGQAVALYLLAHGANAKAVTAPVKGSRQVAYADEEPLRIVFKQTVRKPRNRIML